MKKRIFCLLLVIAVMASLGVTAFAEADVVDPATPDPASTEVNTPPAEANSAENAPATETSESVPASEPAQDQVTEVPGDGAAPQDGAAPEADITTIDGMTPIDTPVPNDTPASTGPTLSADKESISVQDAYACWKAMVADRNSWGTTCPNGFITLTLDGTVDGDVIEWSVVPSEGGAGAGYDGSPGTTCVGIAEGATFYLMGGSNISGCPAGHVYSMDVSATVNGVPTNTVTVTFVCERQEEAGGETQPSVKPDVTADNYAYGVWVHVENGSFTGEFGNPNEQKKDISGAASVWVEFQAESMDEATGAVTYSRKLPKTMPGVTADNASFAGWYTKAPTEQMVDSGDGTFCYRDTVRYNGEQIIPGETEVPDGVQVLYAAFDYHEPAENETHLIQYYYDYNGMNGMYGHCITKTGVKGESFTPGTAAVYSFNFSDADDAYGKEAPTWDGLQAYWARTSFNGYTFKGWSLSEKNGELITQDRVIENGDVFYAVWEKTDDAGNNSDNYVKEGVGPLEFIRIANGCFNQTVHARKNSTATVSILCTPSKALVENVTYTLVFPSKVTGRIEDIFRDPVTATVTAAEPFNGGEKYGFKAEVVGTSLVVTDLDGQAHGMRISVTAEDKDGNVIVAPASASLGFDHTVSGDWKQTKDPTCTEYGQEETTCTECGETVIRKLYPLNHDFSSGYVKVFQDPSCTVPGLEGRVCARCDAPYSQYLKELGLVGGYKDKEVPATGHTYKTEADAEPIRVDDGAKVYKVDCIKGDSHTELKCGDMNNDGSIDVRDATDLFNVVLKDKGSADEKIADVNADGSTDVRDATWVFNFVLGREHTLG